MLHKTIFPSSPEYDQAQVKLLMQQLMGMDGLLTTSARYDLVYEGD